jgi:hypothetical protein
MFAELAVQVTAGLAEQLHLVRYQFLVLLEALHPLEANLLETSLALLQILSAVQAV